MLPLFEKPLDYYTPLALDVEDVPYHAATLVVPQMDAAEEKIVRLATNNLPLGESSRSRFYFLADGQCV